MPGLLYPGIRPPHIATPADRDRKLTVKDFVVDLYLPAAKVKREVEVGSMVTLQRDFAEIGDGISCKAMDNRIALYMMIRAMQSAKAFGCDTYAVATVQEEIGLRGAQVSAFGVDPDIGVALDTTLAVDLPGVPEYEQVTRLGEGAAIKLLDASSISHPGLVAHLKALAKKRKIKYQMEILPLGGTDAGAMQRVRAGVPVATISVPTRYIHSSVELVDKKDLKGGVDLLTAFVEEGQKADLNLV
ncbi:MAG: M42 family metallopeptidase [Candidatus Latescibacterota bacterium]